MQILLQLEQTNTIKSKQSTREGCTPTNVVRGQIVPVTSPVCPASGLQSKRATLTEYQRPQRSRMRSYHLSLYRGKAFVGGSPASSRNIFFLSYSSSFCGATTKGIAAAAGMNGCAHSRTAWSANDDYTLCGTCAFRQTLLLSFADTLSWLVCEFCKGWCRQGMGNHNPSCSVPTQKKTLRKTDGVTRRCAVCLRAAPTSLERASYCNWGFHLVERDGHVDRVVRVAVEREAVQKKKVRVSLRPVRYIHLFCRESPGNRTERGTGRARQGG